MSEDLIGTPLPRAKTCSCGQTYHAVPGLAAVTREGHLWFDCVGCKSSMFVRAFAEPSA